jgi:GH24 family phage-related lysozyme (muramidase)
MVSSTQHKHTIDIGDIWDQVSLKLLFRVLPLTILATPQGNATADRVMQAVGLHPAPVVSTAPSATGEGSATHFQPSAHKPTPINVGDEIGGYTVTSGYGSRRSPCPGCSSNHPAIDLGTPVGTPLYAPGDIEVSCKSAGGAGNYAEFEYQGILHQALHLKSCTPGGYSFGQQFAATGASGNGTGPHLDVRVKQGGQRVLPSKEVIHALLDPSAFALSTPTTPAESGDQGDALQAAVPLIKEFEGFHPNPYWDFAQWTWGYGTKAPGRSGTINQDQAESALRLYLETHCRPIIDGLNVNMNQATALYSFCFNVGPAQFESSTLVGLIRQGAPADSVAWEFGQWTKAGGKELPGLVNRRNREKEIFGK